MQNHPKLNLRPEKNKNQKDSNQELETNAHELWSPINTGIHQGFTDNDLKIAVYTDHQYDMWFVRQIEFKR